MPAVPTHATEREQEEVAALARVVHSREYSQGSEVEAFEQAFAAYVGTRYAVAVGSGGAALQFALRARGVEPGDEVVTSPLAGAAVFRAIHAAGAVAVLAGVDDRTCTLDPESVEERVTARTSAIVAVHQFGCPCDMWSLMSIAGRHGLAVIEDARAAVGAAWGGRKAGGFGEGCFSFTDADPLTAGEGGMVTTNSAEVADAVRSLREPDFFDDGSDGVAAGSRMSELSAVLGKLGLARLDELLEARMANARLLTKGLRDVPSLVPPWSPEHARHIHHPYALRVLPSHPVATDDMCAALQKLGIEARAQAAERGPCAGVQGSRVAGGAFGNGNPKPRTRNPGPWPANPEPRTQNLEPRPLAGEPRTQNSRIRSLLLPLRGDQTSEDIDRILVALHLLAFRLPRPDREAVHAS